jgi:hypothetical protein
MHKQNYMRRVKILSKALTLAGCTAACMSAYAENLPLTLAITETVSRDSNLYRVEPGQYAVADTVSSTGLKIGLDKSYGRQQYKASLGSAINRYFDSKNLNNTSYDLNFNAASEISDKGLISIYGNATQNLARFDVAGYNTVDTVKNTQKSSSTGGQLSYGGNGTLNPYVSINHFQQGFTATSSNYQSSNQNTYGLGTYYSVVPQLNIGLGARITRGDIDYADGLGGSISNDLSRRDIDLTTNWIASGLSSLYARLSSTHETDHYAPNPNIALLDTKTKSWTGEVNWQYTPQGRLSYSINYVRDQGNVGRSYDNTSQFGSVLTDLGVTAGKLNENNRLADTLNAKLTWDLSYKIKINTSASYTRYHLSQTETNSLSTGSTVSSETPTQKSIYSQYSLGGQYQFSRMLNFYCDVRRIKRTEDAEYRPFNATVAACTGQFNINGMN